MKKNNYKLYKNSEYKETFFIKKTNHTIPNGEENPLQTNNKHNQSCNINFDIKDKDGTLNIPLITKHKLNIEISIDIKILCDSIIKHYNFIRDNKFNFTNKITDITGSYYNQENFLDIINLLIYLGQYKFTKKLIQSQSHYFIKQILLLHYQDCHELLIFLYKDKESNFNWLKDLIINTGYFSVIGEEMSAIKFCNYIYNRERNKYDQIGTTLYKIILNYYKVYINECEQTILSTSKINKKYELEIIEEKWRMIKILNPNTPNFEKCKQQIHKLRKEFCYYTEEWERIKQETKYNVEIFFYRCGYQVEDKPIYSCFKKFISIS